MTDGQMIFYCPNGHQLNGPTQLQGQPGQCPRCGTKFVIPGRGERGVPQPNLTPPPSHPEAPDDEELISMSGLDPISPFGNQHDRFGGQGLELHPVEELFATLWRERKHGGVVELHLEGLVIVPDWWAESLSTVTHGVFATQSADGSYVIEAVSWDSIRRLTVRHITELPNGIFH